MNSATPPGGSATSYSYSDQGQATRVTAGSTTYQSDVSGLSVQTTGSSPTYFTRASDGPLLSARTPSGTFYYLSDGLGSVVGLVNGAGHVVNSYSYDPYGNPVSTSEQAANPFRFDGAYYDSATMFYKMGARYYTAGLGRWTQTDALPGGLSNPQSLNLYTFVGNNPINFVDPTGEGCTPTGTAANGVLYAAAIAGVITVGILAPELSLPAFVGSLATSGLTGVGAGLAFVDCLNG